MSDTQSETTGIGAARRWIKSELERCGADSWTSFRQPCEPAGPRLSSPTEIVNVVARLKGNISSDRYYVVNGHYDSRASDVMDAKSCPGANDDASAPPP